VLVYLARFLFTSSSMSAYYYLASILHFFLRPFSFLPFALSLIPTHTHNFFAVLNLVALSFVCEYISGIVRPLSFFIPCSGVWVVGGLYCMHTRALREYYKSCLTVMFF
jgi:hypothetical protein